MAQEALNPETQYDGAQAAPWKDEFISDTFQELKILLCDMQKEKATVQLTECLQRVEANIDHLSKIINEAKEDRS